MTIVFIILLILAYITFVIIKSNHRKRESEERRSRAFEYFQNERIKNEQLSSVEVKVKGTLYRSRKEIGAARLCNVGDTMILVPEPDNEIDSNAIKVYTMEGFHIGYIDAALAELVKSKIDYIGKCVVSKITNHDIPFIYLTIEFSNDVVEQPPFIKKEYQCSPEDKMRNLSSASIDSYDYRRVPLAVQDLYERDRNVIAKARACRKGEKIILKKGVCNELYPDRIDIYLADETYLGYAEPFDRKEVYMLFDKIVDAFVEYPVSSDSRTPFGVRVIFPESVKCPKECMPASSIGSYYSGNYPEVKMASDLRHTDPTAALDILLPVVKKEKGIDAHLECIACYYQLKEWQDRIDMIRATLDRIESYTEEDYPRQELVDMRRYMEKLYKQLEFSQKRLESQDKKRRK